VKVNSVVSSFDTECSFTFIARKQQISENGTSVTKNLHGPFAKPPPVCVVMIGTLGFTASTFVFPWEHFIFFKSERSAVCYAKRAARNVTFSWQHLVGSEELIAAEEGGQLRRANHATALI
jgi:hypothetical protein